MDEIFQIAISLAAGLNIRVNPELLKGYLVFRNAERRRFCGRYRQVGPVDDAVIKEWLWKYDRDFNLFPADAYEEVA